MRYPGLSPISPLISVVFNDYSVLGPNYAVDAGELYTIDYASILGGTLLTDLATTDFLLKGMNALPGAAINQEGANVIFEGGEKATGGGTPGCVQIGLGFVDTWNNLAAVDDFGIGGQLVVNGNTNLNNNLFMRAATNEDVVVSFFEDFGTVASIAVSNLYSQFVFTTKSGTGSQFIFGSSGYAVDYDHPNQADPHIFVHSNDSPNFSNNYFGQMWHNGDDFVISAGPNVGVGSASEALRTRSNGIILEPQVLTSSADNDFAVSIARSLSDSVADTKNFDLIKGNIVTGDISGWEDSLINLLNLRVQSIQQYKIDRYGGYRYACAAAYGGGPDVKVGTVQTSGVGPVTIKTITIANDNETYSVEATVTAMKTDGSARALYHIQGLFYRNGGGAVQEGATQNITTPIESDGSWDCAFAVTGNDIQINLTGVAVTDINWKCDVKYVKVTS